MGRNEGEGEGEGEGEWRFFGANEAVTCCPTSSRVDDVYRTAVISCVGMDKGLSRQPRRLNTSPTIHVSTNASDTSSYAEPSVKLLMI